VRSRQNCCQPRGRRGEPNSAMDSMPARFRVSSIFRGHLMPPGMYDYLKRKACRFVVVSRRADEMAHATPNLEAGLVVERQQNH